MAKQSQQGRSKHKCRQRILARVAWRSCAYSRSTFYSLPVSILSAPARALFYLGRTGRFSVAEPTVGQRRRLITSLPSFDSPTIAAQESGTYGGQGKAVGCVPPTALLFVPRACVF